MGKRTAVFAGLLAMSLWISGCGGAELPAPASQPRPSPGSLPLLVSDPWDQPVPASSASANGPVASAFAALPSTPAQPSSTPSGKAEELGNVVPSQDTLASLGIPPPAPGDPIPSDQPNYFDASQMSSGGILAAIEACKQGAVRSDPNLNANPTLLQALCACTADALRKNKGRMPLDFAKHAATWQQLRQCGEFARAEALSFSGPTPFNLSQIENSNAIAKFVQGCESKAEQDGLSMVRRIIYCACYVDAVRSHKDRPMITAQQNQVCERIASYRELTKRHLTRQQFLTMSSTK